MLFDKDSTLTYRKSMQIYQSIYSNLDTPQDISLPKVTSDELMILKSVLESVRKSTNTINRNLIDLEDELIEQASEKGNNDAITLLSFKTISDPKASRDDKKYAQKLIDDLSNMKHPLVFKLAGDLAYGKNAFQQAVNFWLQFIELENDTIAASHVYTNLGIFYYTLQPKPDLVKAKHYLEKALHFGEPDATVIKAHFYYSQLFTITDPKTARYHLEICASKGAKESLLHLGFLELNTFNNYEKSLEWFKLGNEEKDDLKCLIGEFESYVGLKQYRNAMGILQDIKGIYDTMKTQPKTNNSVAANLKILETFYRTREKTIRLVGEKAF
ncbi:protein Mss2p, mitochondrial [[Candida] jaroonii]|uniref:Protein Mss2p, mitochondrial n=1 Tax=[Candida] jaroonii TaxID=467808 RepID=A0ACA9Y181_9ASCO|nr:protein Mss2p, mitochondrial [[Candida] jaroonii]